MPLVFTTQQLTNVSVTSPCASDKAKPQFVLVAVLLPFSEEQTHECLQATDKSGKIPLTGDLQCTVPSMSPEAHWRQSRRDSFSSLVQEQVSQGHRKAAGLHIHNTRKPKVVRDSSSWYAPESPGLQVRCRETQDYEMFGMFCLLDSLLRTRDSDDDIENADNSHLHSGSSDCEFKYCTEDLVTSLIWLP
eukprot:1835008-Amphidinium_carterae.1